MLKKDGELLLEEFAMEAYPKSIIKVSEGIYHVIGYGHSNSIVIEGKSSLILVDTLDSSYRAKAMKEDIEKITKKSVKTIIYTHGHPDHRGGAGAFKDTVEEIIAFAPKRAVLKYMDKISDVLNRRTVRQFGYELTDEEAITQGIGIREGHAINEGTYDFLQPTTIYNEDVVERVIDGVSLKLVSAVGETDDQLFVWLEDSKVLCCGDNYYGCFPNLYAIRGGQYRDIATWVDSLKNILSYPAEALLPGHTKPIFGYENIQDILGDFTGAIEYILLQTLDCMNKGMSEDEVVANVNLPEEYKGKPYLGEFYGTVDWAVRSIYGGYVGWFDGNPTNLNPLSMDVYSRKMVEFIGGEEKIINEIKNALNKEEYQWAIQLCDLVIDKNSEAKRLKAEGLIGLSKLITSANGRHYYIACAKELM